MRRLFAVTGASFEQRSQLEHALKSRIAIEQAKGIMAERLRLTIDEAYEVLRGAARSNRRPVRDLAADVVEQRETPKEILAQLTKKASATEAQEDRPGSPRE